jgi:hypothetical protein
MFGNHADHGKTHAKVPMMTARAKPFCSLIFKKTVVFLYETDQQKNNENQRKTNSDWDERIEDQIHNVVEGSPTAWAAPVPWREGEPAAMVSHCCRRWSGKRRG